MIDFTDWLRNNMLSHSGIQRQQLRGSQRKRVLTCVQTGVVACQDIRTESFDQWFDALMRADSAVITNFDSFARKPR